MANPFEIFVQELVNQGFYGYFLPFILTGVIVYALLRKSKVLGDSVTGNGIVAVAVAFMVLAFPVFSGINLQTQFATFFVQSSVFILIFVIGLILASLYYPDLQGMLASQFKSRGWMFIALIIVITFFVSSGLIGAFTNIGNPLLTGQEPTSPGVPTDIIIVVVGIILAMVVIIVAATVVAKGGGH